MRRTLASPYFQSELAYREQEEAILALREDATVVEITVVVEGIATHPEDDLVLAAAVSGQVDYLVTRDRQLLRLGAYEGIRIVSTPEFLALLPPEGAG